MKKLIHEAYERSKKDLKLSHILISVPSSTPNDTTLAYKRITELKDKLNKGADFSTLAKEYSDDKTTKENGGELGYFTSLFPNGFYNVETAVYKLKAGQVTDPIRSSLGYHLFKVDDIRDARGEIEVSHILIRTKKDDKNSETIAKAKIDSIYQLLTRGENFEDMAEQYSQDKGSSLKGGYIGFFGINRYEKPFEDAAFGLKKDGAYSMPIETSAGWHIIKRISARPIGDYENARKRIEPKVKTDSRFDEAREVLLEKLKRMWT
ncbi:MAG: peptidylprolyl isomerase [Saprospiraceae bacterium]|nr:peptidylprolyl isomerase [Saprospiraceae bacterium]